MGLVISIAGGMILWIVLWALGAKGFDGGLVFMIVVLLAATGRVVGKVLPGKDPEQSRPDPAPFT